MSTYNINNIRNDFDSYNQLINLYAQNKNSMFTDISVNLSGWFSANVCSMFGAILTKFQDNLNMIDINAGDSKNILERNGFLSFFGHEKVTDYNNNTTLPYKVLSIKDDRYFHNYIFKEFIGKLASLHITNALKKKLTESIYEIFINAKMHSKTEKI